MLGKKPLEFFLNIIRSEGNLHLEYSKMSQRAKRRSLYVYARKESPFSICIIYKLLLTTENTQFFVH